MPDIAIVTEAWVDHLGPDFHHTDAGPSGISHLGEDERKVVIASRWPISNVIIDLDVPTPGRFVSAQIETPEGSLMVIGVCIPWYASRVRSGDARNWEDHRAFLGALSPMLHENAQSSCLVAGDFNQRVPRSRQLWDVADLLKEAFQHFEVPTAGERPEAGKQLIDHIAISPSLQSNSIVAWPEDLEGKKMSDHDGVLLEVSMVDS